MLLRGALSCDTSPATGSDGRAHVNQLLDASALCSDDTASALLTTLLSVRRSDGQYFNGRGFQAEPISLPLSLIPNKAQDRARGRALNLPRPPTRYTLARYTLEARTTDQAGNVGAATREIIVQPAPAG